jgi:hypothetical protein
MEIPGARLSFTRKSQPVAGTRPVESAAPHTAQMPAPSVPPPGFTARLPATRALMRYVVSRVIPHIF